MTVTFTGDYNTFFTPTSPFAAKINEAVWRGATIIKTGDVGSLEINDYSTLTPTEAIAMANAGVEVEGYPAFIEMTTAKKVGNVPVGINGRLAVDDDGNETVRTWIDWATAHGRTWSATGTKHYIEGSNGRTYLKGSELVVLTTGYSVITPEAYNALFPSDGGE